VAGNAVAHQASLLIVSSVPREQRFGTLQRDLPIFKDFIDYRLTRFPRLYLFIERFREWINWDKRVYLSFVQRGDTVLDVGANVGAHAVFLSHLVGEKGKVLAFEPLPPNVEAISETMRKRSRIDNISVLQLAVGNPAEAGRPVVIRAPADDLTQASLQLQQAGSWQLKVSLREFTVPLTSLDMQAHVQALSAIDFVKIDVEGGELDVLKGAERTLRRHRPLVYCEVYERWAASFGYSPGDLFQFMSKLGYVGARAISKGRIVSLGIDGKVPAELFDTSSDVLFFAPGKERLVDVFDKRYSR
jgi:FkbM family methyltransferase